MQHEDSDFWELLWEQFTLTDEHALQLKQHRGFNKEVIKQYRFKSGDLNNSRALETIRSRYPQLPIPKYALGSGTDTLNNQLLENHILIPYIDASGSIYKVRPHKLGFKNDPLRVYRTATSYKASHTCIIAESEFKAVAAECFGYSAIGIPGISSMIGQYWDKFLKEVRSIDATEFVILFDNETKDNPKFKNYKADWKKRYDVHIFAYAFCQKLINDGIHCRIGSLPDAWQVEGKIDIDGALAARKPKERFREIIDSAVGPKKYLDNLNVPEEHRGYLTRRVKKFFYFSNILERPDGFYSKELDKDGNEVQRRLTNCLIKIKNTYEDALQFEGQGITRDVVIIDEYAIESNPIHLSAINMAGRAAFTTWLMSQGNYLFYGNDRDLLSLWEHIFTYDQGDIIFYIRTTGWEDTRKFWIFKNLIIKPDGNILYPDEQEILWDDHYGFKLGSRVKGDDSGQPLPALSVDEPFDLNQYLKLLENTVDSGNPGRAKCFLAWVFAIYFMRPIVEQYRFFPIIFFHGEKQSGKTTIMRWLTSFFGIFHNISLARSTIVGVNQALSFYSDLPLILDDWRENDDCRRYVQTFLGVYNRQAGIKGTRSGKYVRVTPVRSALAIMGEDMIADNGLQSRCLIFHITKERIRECMTEMEPLIPMASTYTLNFFRDRRPQLESKIIPAIEKKVKQYKSKFPGLDQRTIYNYSILSASYDLVVGSDEQLEQFIASHIQVAQSDITKYGRIFRFAEEFQFAASQNLIHDGMYKYDLHKNTFTLWIRGIHTVLNKYYNRKEDHTDVLIKQIMVQDYFVKAVRASFSGTVGKFPSLVLDLHKMPPALSEYFSAGKITPEDRAEMVDGIHA